MHVTKLGNGLAVRLSADEVERLGLKEGDEVEVSAVAHGANDSTYASRLEALKSIRQYRGSLPADFKFDRDEANRRD
jgi:antitoxin MazE